ncbi:MAG TPA: hypothetical protein DGG94_01200 [Micromonosporaceae bacterium]|nr:hypothetical protein [Micromonosporaceae bacterium]HCU48445.1 hypothetical protein [Micromonosporaceae bacterium]
MGTDPLDGLNEGFIEGVLGHVIVAFGPDESGEPSVALWSTSPLGHPTGAWVYGVATALAEGAVASEVLGLTRHRALIAWDLDAAIDFLSRLEDTAGVPATAWKARAVLLPESFDEMRRYRIQLIGAVGEHAATSKSKIAPLAWKREIPISINTMNDLMAACGVPEPISESAVVSAALRLAAVIRWSAELWQETEEGRLRRRYLDLFGPAAPLPPTWLAALKTAQSQSAVTEEST